MDGVTRSNIGSKKVVTFCYKKGIKIPLNPPFSKGEQSADKILFVSLRGAEGDAAISELIELFKTGDCFATLAMTDSLAGVKSFTFSW